MFLIPRKTDNRGRSRVPNTFFFLILLSSGSRFSRFTRFAPDDLANVADPFSFVWFNFSGQSDLGGDLAYFLRVDPLDLDPGPPLDLKIDPRRRVKLDRMGIAKLQLQLLPLHRGAITDADQVQLLLEAFGHADDLVLNHAVVESLDRHGLPVAGSQNRRQLPFFDLDLNDRFDQKRDGPFRPFGADLAVRSNLDLD